ncbi:SusC/RagA family TonB-linked outer membrane protein [Mucilaginibacter sp. SJ]|uniref:SusC/RagA family TonB-linked outer membrane protein n=1 Tax=Mucilaginibacter sp. SJ TaxID=3029053 RepID=UPI0023A9410F|nr:TonB-dependent receptor [Mucilaginibacter sp. SJ]WEA02375.1 TonB-dependent receptor [Mucilaginibacter sp. SJ]
MNLPEQLLFNAGHRRQKIRFLNRSFVLSFFFLLAMTCRLFAQADKTVSGTVRDEHDRTLPGVSITVKGTSTGTTTDANGHYSLKVKGGSGTLIFSFIGYASIEENINNRTTINISLAGIQKDLNEIVVIGYGTVKRRDLTGAVASVSGKDIAATPVPNVAQAMQGKLPGVNVTSQDGRPGAGINIRVRGGTSISQSNQALVLIDGVPGNLNDIPGDQVESIDVLKDASSAAIYGSRGANGVVLVTTKSAKAGKTNVSYNGYAKINTPNKYLQALNPYDYLQYVWANAAANGTAYQTPFEQLYGLGANAGNNTGGIESYRNLATDDIQKQAYKQSVSWNHALTITGGTDKTKVLFSATYSDDEGMKLQSYQRRATAAFKLTQKIFDNVTFDINTRYANTPTLGDESVTSGSGSILSSAYRFRPIATNHILGNVSALTASNNISQYGKNALWDSYSPVARISDYNPLSLSSNFVGIASLNWVIIKGLTYHTDFSGNGTWTQRKYWSGATYNGYIDDATGNKLYAGNADYRKNDSWGLRWANTLGYEFNINKDNKISLLAGTEFFNSGGTGISIQANYFPSNFTQQTAFAQINQYDRTKNSFAFSSSVNTPDRLNSYFARAMYNFKDKYLLTLTFRADGSSRFAANNRWGYFPGGAFAWRISQEPFMKDVNWVDNWKFRASFGAVGNNNIPTGLNTQSWGSVTDPRNQYDINHTTLAAYSLSNPTILSNPNLKWETTITRDIGTDFSLFGDKLSGTVDVYWNTTKDVLTQTTIPGVTGFTYTYANIGQISNRGIELSLLGTIFKNQNWRVTAGGNITFNKNKVDKLADNVTGLYGTNWASSATYPASDYQLVVGRPVGLVRGLTYDGFYTPNDFTYSNGMYTLNSGVPDLTSVSGGVVHGVSTGTDRPTGQIAYPGLPKYKDLNNDGKIDDKDLSVIGNTTPKFTGGFNISVAYKNIDLGLNFNYSVGNDIYNVNKLASLYGPKEAGIYENKLAIMANAYKIYNVVNGQLVRLKTPDEFNAANVNADLPLANSETGVTSTLGIEKGSFLRLNTLTLGYTVSKSALKKVGIGGLRVYGSVYNLLTITGYKGLDPEVGVNDNANNSPYPTTGFDFGSYPRARSFVVGVNLNF